MGETIKSVSLFFGVYLYSVMERIDLYVGEKNNGQLMAKYKITELKMLLVHLELLILLPRPC